MAEPRHVGDLLVEVGVEQSLMSHHLRLLREAGFVLARRDGKRIRYELAPGVGVTGNPKSLDLGCCHLHFDGS